ncbi:TonB-dependent receptor [Pseudidiomarina marina]|uniref:TonB-dependent receptor n=1 Tax=Pseudidiomarina marina TaxID=502366 RepID=A0A432YGI6_9GAMM|nr:TonB-dependent receptor [Pseudidiomarina marina]PHR66647.1 MAG: TonB-dependent receptor [Idiomarina sp.]RUO60015.1 TonB-dependent receptor [Pseudidiomarina marina]
MDRKYIIIAFIYGILGIALGMWMAATANHRQLPTHTHMMLLGFTVPILYAALLKVWMKLTEPTKELWIQFGLHQLGTLGLTIGLYLLYGGYIKREVLDPFLGVSSLLTFAGFILIFILFLKRKSPA